MMVLGDGFLLGHDVLSSMLLKRTGVKRSLRPVDYH